MNLFALSGILLGATCIILVLIVAIYGKTRLHRAWLFTNLAVAIWGVGAYFIGKASDPSSAVTVWQFAMIGVIFIPVTLYHTMCIFCNVESTRKKQLILAYVQGLFFLFLDFIGRFVTKVKLVFGSLYYPQFTGLEHIFFLAIWIGLVVLGLCELIKYYRKSGGVRKIQCRYLLIAFVIGFCGGTPNFLPMYGVNLYPIGNFAIPIYSLVTTFGMVRYRLMDIHIVLKKSLIYSLSVSLLTGLFLSLVFLMTKYLTEVIAIPSFTITVICTLIIAFLFTPLKNKVQSFVDRAFYKTTYDYYTTVNRMSHDLALSIGLHPTYNLIVDTIVDTLKLKKAYLLSVQNQSIEPAYAKLSRQGTSDVDYAAPLSLGVEEVEHAHNGWDGKRLPKDSQLVSVLTGGNILIKEELFTLKDQDAATAIAAELRPYGGEVAVPIFIDGNLDFLLILGEKWSSDAFTVEDINLLSTISGQASIALKNAKLYDELEVRVRERTAQLTLANNLLQEQIAEKKRAEEALKSSNEEIKSFAYIVSHDMRAPLVNIKGFSSELKLTLNRLLSLVDDVLPLAPHKEQKELRTLLETTVPKALGFIESSAKRIDAQIGAILKLLRVGRKELNPEQLNMGNVFESILGTLTHQIKTSNVKITIGTLPEIVADRSSMEQIIGNLLDNALKYLEPGRDGELEITSEQNQDETIFHIRDNGRGIAKDDMQKVFEIFRRVGKPDVQGEGMGLAYVKALVKGLGGRIWCESELGVGTTFSFSISNSIILGSNSKAFE